MRAKTIHLLLLLAMLLAASCSDRRAAPTPSESTPSVSQQEEEPSEVMTISADAAAAFAELAPVTISEEETWGTFRIVSAESKAAYIVDEELFAGATSKYGLAVGNTKVVGETQDLEGLFQVDLSRPAIGPNRFAVYLPTLRTDQVLRDGWIRENALQSDRFPLAVFIAKRVLEGPGNYQEGVETRFQLEGDLTLRGITLTTVWDVAARLGESTIRGTLQTRLRMTDLGFDPPNFANTLTVQDEFTVRIDFVAHEQ
jgi:polyisoprenoid-binding protein YceI